MSNLIPVALEGDHIDTQRDAGQGLANPQQLDLARQHLLQCDFCKSNILTGMTGFLREFEDWDVLLGHLSRCPSYQESQPRR